MTSTSRRSSPTLRRRRLEDELKRLRRKAGLSSTEVARTLGWSQGKLSKIEGGIWIRPNPRDAEDLGKLYGAGKAKCAELVALAKGAKEKDGWWYPYRQQISQEYTAYIGYEAAASKLLAFEPLVIHGLLQTEAYTKALIRAGSDRIDAEQLKRYLTIRRERQNLLHAEDPLELWIVLDEAALLRGPSGPDGPEIMREQLRHILDVAELPLVTIQVTPFNAGFHPGVKGPLTVLSFPDPEDPPAIYLDSPGGQLFIEEPEEVRRFTDAFDMTRAIALSPEDSLRFMANLAA